VKAFIPLASLWAILSLTPLAFGQEGPAPRPDREEAPAAQPDLERRIRLGWIGSLRGGYVFPGSEPEPAGNVGLVAGKDVGNASKSHALRPLGLELGADVPVGKSTYLQPSLRIQSAALRLTPASEEQQALDGMLTLSYGFLPRIGEHARAGFELGARLRRWQMESGPLPSMGHLGLTVALRYERPGWEALLEAGLMAIGQGVPDTAGVQRDSSTVRARLGHRIDLKNTVLVPALEFFHTHRSFYGSSLLAGETSFFADEAVLSLIVVLEL